jgi:hypothetical protein
MLLVKDKKIKDHNVRESFLFHFQQYYSFYLGLEENHENISSVFLATESRAKFILDSNCKDSL